MNALTPARRRELIAEVEAFDLHAAVAAAEGPISDRLAEAAERHAEILRRSRELACCRVLR